MRKCLNQVKFDLILKKKIKKKKEEEEANFDLRMFFDKSLFDSLFYSESCVFYYRFHPPLKKLPFMAIYSRKIGVWGWSQTMWDSLKTRIKCKMLSLHSLWNPSYVHMPMYGCVYVWLKCVYRYVCMHAHTLGFLVAVLFQKKKLFLQK